MQFLIDFCSLLGAFGEPVAALLGCFFKAFFEVRSDTPFGSDLGAIWSRFGSDLGAFGEPFRGF